jgi:hypothetical protein
VSELSPQGRLLFESLVVAVWIGLALFFAAVVAPAAFAVLPSRALAGALVGRVLPVIFVTGALVGGLIAGMELTVGARGSWRAGGALVLAASCAIAQLVVTPRIERLRAAIGPSLESLAPDDARRLAFGRLHALSVGWLGVAMVAAAVVLVAALLPLRGRH